MSAVQRGARRRLLVALALTLTASGLYAGSASGLDPTQRARSTTVSAETDPQAAADAINEYCSDAEKCQWNNDDRVELDYGPNRIVGDMIYNCTPGADVEGAIGVEDERGESTSLEEKLSLEVSANLIGLAKQSAEFSAFSKQTTFVKATATSKKAVTVEPGWKGWIDSSVLSANFTGSVTSGINLEVSDVDLSIAGALAPGMDPKDGPAVVWSAHSAVMTSAEFAAACPRTIPSRTGTTARRAAPRDRERFTLVVCRAGGRDGRVARDCVRRTVSGWEAPPKKDKVTAKLMRGGTTYAVERNRKGNVRLVLRRDITPGTYELTLKEKPRHRLVKEAGNRHHATFLTFVHVPLRIRWSMKE